MWSNQNSELITGLLSDTWCRTLQSCCSFCFSNYTLSYITQRYTFHAVKPFTAIILYYYIFIPNVFLVTTSCNGASQSENFTLQVLLLCVIMNRKLSCDYRLCMSACNYCTLSGKQLLRYFQLFLSVIVNSLLSFSSSQKQNELNVKGELWFCPSVCSCSRSCQSQHSCWGSDVCELTNHSTLGIEEGGASKRQEVMC